MSSTTSPSGPDARDRLRRIAARASAAFAVCLSVAACSALQTHVRVRNIPPARSVAADGASIASGPSLSRASLTLLSQLRLRWPEHCNAVLRAVAEAPLPPSQRDFALAELNLAGAGTERCERPRARLLLDAARHSHSLIAASGTEDHAPPLHVSQQIYNRAIAELFAGRACCVPGAGAVLAARAAELGIRVDDGSIDLARRFDRVIDADALSFTGLIDRHRRFGVGAALVGIVSTPNQASLRGRSMEAGDARAITALLRFDAAGAARLELHESADASVCFAARRMPLGADFTAPYAWLMSQSRQRAIGLRGAFQPERAVPQRGLILLEPFDAGRIPVLMIHGFGSSPQAWRNITNEILASPDLRDRFQVWHYLYPTGLTYLYSAGALRNELAALLAQLRQDHGADAVLPIAVIGHSQGGLMARALVTRSDSQLWDLVFRVPPQSLTVDPVMREIFRSTLFFEPLPDVQTVVFMATPNSGMSSTDNWLVAWLLNMLIDLPDRAAHELRKLRREHSEQLNSLGRRWFARGGLTVVESVEDDNPLMQTFGRLPLAQDRHYHSIIALRRNGSRIEEGDGYVPRDSAHVPEAESELIVYGGHRDTDGVEVIAELHRILRAHALRVHAEHAEHAPEDSVGACEPREAR